MNRIRLKYLVDDFKLKFVHHGRLQLQMITDQFQLGGCGTKASEEEWFKNL